MIVLDTLRADRTSVYGAARRTTPALEQLAEDGVVFERALTNATWTLPAMAGIVSGRYLDATVFDRKLRASLVEVLRDAGFATAAFSEGGFFSRRFGFDLGFEQWSEQRFPSLMGAAPTDPAPADAARPDEIATTFRNAFAWLEAPRESPSSS